MSTLFSFRDSKLRVVLTITLLIVGVIGTFILDNDTHQAFAAMSAVIGVLVQVFYWSSDYDAPF